MRRGFCRRFGVCCAQLWSVSAKPALVGQALLEMAQYFKQHDYDITMRSQPVWECFLAESSRGYAATTRLHGVDGEATLLDVTDTMRLLYRWLTVLTVRIPPVDVVHAASGGICSILGMIGGRSSSAAFLLTEHGLYLRERLLALAREEGTFFSQVFQARFAQRITEASYFYADRIAPGSNYNHRWELHGGRNRSKSVRSTTGPIRASSRRPGIDSPLMRHRASCGWVGSIL